MSGPKGSRSCDFTQRQTLGLKSLWKSERDFRAKWLEAIFPTPLVGLWGETVASRGTAIKPEIRAKTRKASLIEIEVALGQ
jgi:hypothetical protein